jgi:Holliday junction resolvase
MTESQIQKQAIELLKLSGYLVFRLNSGKARNNIRLCPPGTPDLLAVKDGLVLWIEMKKPRGVLSDAQGKMISDLRLHRQTVLIADSISDIINFIGG